MRCIWVRDYLKVWCSLCTSIKFCGIVVQVEMCKFDCFVLADGAFADKFGESAGERCARGMCGNPETLFGAESFVEREGIGAVHHFVRVKSEQLFEDRF